MGTAEPQTLGINSKPETAPGGTLSKIGPGVLHSYTLHNKGPFDVGNIAVSSVCQKRDSNSISSLFKGLQFKKNTIKFCLGFNILTKCVNFSFMKRNNAKKMFTVRSNIK